MADDELSQITAGQFETLPHLLASSEALQIAFAIMAIGIIAIIVIYKRLSSWIKSQRFYYERPHVSRFVRSVMLPIIAIVLVTAINVHVQTVILSEEAGMPAQSIIGEGATQLSASETFAKILNTFTIIVTSYAISQMIPIILTKRDRSIDERADFNAWFEMRGFADDDGDFFHKMYKWVPPRNPPEDMDAGEFEEMLHTKEGMLQLEKFRTTKGNPIGGYEKITKDPFEEWKKSERAKYAKYYEDCTSGNNQSGIKLKPGAKVAEIYPIDLWREEKRLGGYERVIPSARPPGYASKKRHKLPKSIKNLLPIGLFAATILGVLGWWGVDLFVVATATGGFSIGLGLALQETMKNYFAYMRIRKDNVFVEGDRIQLESGYNGFVHRITPLVTYVRDGLNESIAIIPTSTMVESQIINYTKENQLVPATINVGVSYLNDPRQVAAILTKVGLRAMNEIVDAKRNHLIRQHRCPYLDQNKPSCGCDKDLHVDVTQPVVRFTSFNDSSLDFALWVYVRDYGAQFKTTTDMRIITYEEFQRYDIRIPWPIRTIYQGDEKREAKEIGALDKDRDEVVKKYGMADRGRGDGDD